MHYDLRLEISYRYDSPASNGRHLLRLMPLALPGEQTVLHGALDISPRPDERHDRRDFFGNATTEIAFRQPVEDLVLSLSARVRRMALAPSLDLSPDLDRLARDLTAIDALGPDAPHHFRAASPRVALSPKMTAYARDQLAPGMTTLQIVTRIGRALHRDMRFEAGATDVHTPPLAAFTARRGVCQDFSHIMIACLRGVGIPAGYVSGFLRTIPPEGQPRLEGADAMHAWVRAWCGPDNGWVQYDPTNDLLVGADHIVTALGRDYADVAPVRGVLRTSGGQDSGQKVDVLPLPAS
ncbi:MAG: transglutaminase [Confluentimicrobium sp.]|nr:transglutaminase [Actibacterium sp.]